MASQTKFHNDSKDHEPEHACSEQDDFYRPDDH